MNSVVKKKHPPNAARSVPTSSYINYQLSIINYQLKKMENENKSIWSKILKVVITILTAVATTFGLQACY